jgi:H/ACA ribonucleoprotein complex subunit 3
MNAQPRAALAPLTLGGRALRLRDADLLGAGGEGKVYRHGATGCIKIFDAPLSPEQARKLRAFPSRLPGAVVGPQELVLRGGEPAGYLMTAVHGAFELAKLGQRSFRAGNLGNNQVLALFARLRELLLALHKANVVVGDLNAGNVLAQPDVQGELCPWLIDAASMQYAGFPCAVAHERTCDPALYGMDLAMAPRFTPGTDWYAFAVLLFQSLMYVHPFGGTHPAYGTMIRRAQAGVSVFGPQVVLPKNAGNPMMLPVALAQWFVAVFEKGHRAAPDAALLSPSFVPCVCGAEHGHATCPSCATRVAPAPVSVVRGTVRCATVFRRDGATVVTARGGAALSYVVRLGGQFLREDGVPIPVAPVPGQLFVLDGARTWVATPDGQVLAFQGGLVQEQFSVDVREGEPAIDAARGTTCFVRDGSVLRHETQTRAGQVIKDRARVFLGTVFGLVVYDIGKFAVHAVFDRTQGALRDVPIPPPAGRVTQSHAIFDEDGSAMYVRETDAQGVLRTERFIISRTGAVLGAHGAPADDATFGTDVAGCLVRGRLLLAAAGGLALVSVDAAAATLAVARRFPDTAPFVAPGAQLFPATAGAVYVVTPQEITLVSL